VARVNTRRTVVADPISEAETAILERIRKSQAAPHQKILSRQKMVKLLGLSPYLVQQAINRLNRRGYLYTRKGSGVFFIGENPGPEAPPTPAVSPTSTTTSDNASSDLLFSPFTRPPSRPSAFCWSRSNWMKIKSRCGGASSRRSSTSIPS